MVRVIVQRSLKNFEHFEEVSRRFGENRWKKELHRGVISAGRKVRTKVQKAVRDQMAVAPGSYQSYVVANMRFRSDVASLSATISASAKGGQITDFKGIRALKAGGRVARRANRGNSFPGLVKSSVWNQPRVFKRSFESKGGFFALIRSNGAAGNSTMPRAFWTHDDRDWQDRDAGGKFSGMGTHKWRVRRLRGPAIGKELDQGASLATFLQHGPIELEREVKKRMETMINW